MWVRGWKKEFPEACEDMPALEKDYEELGLDFVEREREKGKNVSFNISWQVLKF
jgi:hypothetical protein